jgi:sugar/nucleoside kinase (ribokinase family)
LGGGGGVQIGGSGEAGGTASAMFSADGIGDLVGGAAANVACGLRARGADVRFGAAIGRDPIGDLVLGRLAALGVSTEFIRPDWPVTSRTVVLIDPHGDRLCINDPKVANQYRFPDAAVDAAIGPSPLVFTSTQSWCRHVVRRARELGRRVAVDVQLVTLMKRSFGFDALRCQSCGKKMRVLATITDAGTVRRILEHLGLRAEPLTRAPARDPPWEQTDLGFEDSAA